MALRAFTQEISRCCRNQQDALAGHSQALQRGIDFVAECTTFKSAAFILENASQLFLTPGLMDRLPKMLLSEATASNSGCPSPSRSVATGETSNSTVVVCTFLKVGSIS